MERSAYYPLRGMYSQTHVDAGKSILLPLPRITDIQMSKNIPLPQQLPICDKNKLPTQKLLATSLPQRRQQNK